MQIFSRKNVIFFTFRKKAEKAERSIFSDTPLYSVPRAGVEPARIAPLVFETSASTDSAIWARGGFLHNPDRLPLASCASLFP